jgi:hypothetical protein
MKSKRISILATLFALAIIGLSAFALNLMSARGQINGQDLDASTAAGRLGGGRFEVTITNLTRFQYFTPVLVASHREGVRLFNMGEPVCQQFAILAEEGNPTPMADLLSRTPGVKDVVVGSNLIKTGESQTFIVDAPEPFDHVSVASMLGWSNDAFFALNGVEGPRDNKELTLYSPAYDSGSERNDESCASIPGAPECSKPSVPANGDNPTGGEEGFVHIHSGIHGIGDLMAAQKDWRNPVAKITIRRVR